MKILGFDPGINKCGYGIISKVGSKIWHIDNGLIITDHHTKYHEKLKTIYDKTTELIERFQADTICLETVFYAKNVHSTIMLASARTAVILASIKSGKRVLEFFPREVKKAVCGNGNATKQQVQEMIKVILNLRDAPYEDASDALAIALSGAFFGVCE